MTDYEKELHRICKDAFILLKKRMLNVDHLVLKNRDIKNGTLCSAKFIRTSIKFDSINEITHEKIDESIRALVDKIKNYLDDDMAGFFINAKKIFLPIGHCQLINDDRYSIAVFDSRIYHSEVKNINFQVIMRFISASKLRKH